MARPRKPPKAADAPKRAPRTKKAAAPPKPVEPEIVGPEELASTAPELGDLDGLGAVDALPVDVEADAVEPDAAPPRRTSPRTSPRTSMMHKALPPRRATSALVANDARREPGGRSGAVPLARGGGEVARSDDPLARYMAEVSRHPLLAPDEEHALAVKFQQTGDVAAAYKLVTANLRLVVKIAYEYRRAAFQILDLVQEGNVGLMQAVRKYDPYRGVKLSSYAAWWIRAYILRYLMDNWRLVRLGTTQAQRKLFFNLKKEKAKLAQAGFEPEAKLLAARLNVSEQDVVEMDQRLGQDDVALDAPMGDDSSATHQERLAATSAGAEDVLGDKELRAMFKEKLSRFGGTLEGKERYIFEKRLVADEAMTLQDIGDHFSISRERARQLEARLIERLREELKHELPDFRELSIGGTGAGPDKR